MNEVKEENPKKVTIEEKEPEKIVPKKVVPLPKGLSGILSTAKSIRSKTLTSEAH